MNFGLAIEGVREFGEYVFGGSKVPYIPYQEDGDWTPYLPKYESQSDRFPTCCCTVWGSQNQIEILYKRLYGNEPNYSERFNSALLQIQCPGIDPQKTYENIRSCGLVDADDFPMPGSLEEFLDKTAITGSLLAKGQNWLVKHDFLHEWLWTSSSANNLTILKDALKTSPIAVSVTAWYNVSGLYVDNGQKNNHWVVCYKVDDTGIYIFDSHDHSEKKLALNHNIQRAKRIWINKRTKFAMRRHITILEAIIKRLLMKPTLLEVCKKNLGQDASPKDISKDEVACAETVTTLLKQVYPDTPIITGTWTLYEYLKDPKNGWKQVLEPKPESIIISPTGTGKAGTIGHVGIIDDGGLVMSNNSYGVFKGRFTQNYTLDLWKSKYRDTQGMLVAYFDRA